MKIIFLFGGALTANQELAVEHELDQGNEVELLSVLDTDIDYDKLVYGAGFGGLSELSNAVSFSDYLVEEPIEQAVSVDKELDFSTDCGGDCGEDCGDCE